MRAITGQENAVLNAPDGHSVAVRVWVWDGAAYQDVTALEGRSWLVGVEWDESVNEGCAQARVSLRRRLEDLSLNPLVSNKLTGVLALARPFIIEAATIPLGDPVAETDYREVFRGTVETLSLDKDPISFTGRDLAGPLSRNFIEEERDYGSDSGVAVETIIQSILTDNSTGVTLYVRNVSGGTTTGAVFGVFRQKKAAVLGAVRELALKIGWDLRYEWHDGSSTWRFTLIEPDRPGAAGSVWTFQPHKVKAVTKLEQTLFDVRNVVRVYFYNRGVVDEAGKATLDDVTAEDATSITTYQRQYMQLAEDENSPIDSASEALVMANAALADLKDPLLDLGVDVGFHYAVQLGDLLTFAADDLHFSNPQTLAVISVSHRIEARGHRTSLQLRGKPVGANDEWLRREGRVRVMSQPPASAPDPVSALTATATAGGAVIAFTAPVTPPVPVEFELHLSTTSGFTASSVTFVERSAATSFTRNGLTPGITYYAQVIGRDKVGNRSAAVEASFVPRYVEPRSLQPFVVPGVIPNDSFEANNGAGSPPDTWTLSVGIWGIAATTTSTAYSGTVAVRLEGGYASELVSQPVTSREGEVITYEVFAMRPTSAGTPITSLWVDWLNDTGGVVASENALIGYGAAGVWTRDRAASVAPVGTRYLRLRLTHSALAVDAVIVDSCRVLYSRFAQEAVTTITAPGASFTTVSSPYLSFGYYMSANTEVVLRGALTRGAAGGGTVLVLPPGYRPLATQLFACATTAGIITVTVQSDGQVIASSPAAGAIVSFDGVRFRPSGA